MPCWVVYQETTDSRTLATKRETTRGRRAAAESPGAGEGTGNQLSSPVSAAPSSAGGAAGVVEPRVSVRQLGQNAQSGFSG